MIAIGHTTADEDAQGSKLVQSMQMVSLQLYFLTTIIDLVTFPSIALADSSLTLYNT